MEAETAALYGNRERIEEICRELRGQKNRVATEAAERLPLLARRVSSRIAQTNAPVVALLGEIAASMADPWPTIDALLESNEAGVVAFALETLGQIALMKPDRFDDRVLRGLALHADRESGPFTTGPVLALVAKVLAHSAAAVPLESVCASHPEFKVRKLAARILDLDGSLPSEEVAAEILGAAAAAGLAPHLAWTRATHLDLYSIAAGDPATLLDSLKNAEQICGEKLLREIVGEIGWPHLNLGLTVQPFVGVSIAGSFPLLLHPAEEALFDTIESKRHVFDRLLVTAYGGERRVAAAAGNDAIARFRSYNLAHAELLAGFLDVTPLTVEKVARTVERMTRIVDDFLFLFASFTDECPTLVSLFAELKSSIERALAAEGNDHAGPLSSELTRLVDMFEDPRSLADVHTLHGLKRYLHQRGLKLGMRLAETGGRPGCGVTLLLASGDRVVQSSRSIEYVDFEAGEGDDGVPYAVRVVIEEFGRQVVHAQQALPKVKVFCYGNEVHYFVYYRNHPAFVRIDYSPPARGGMIDLAYFGVSKYELDSHPDTSLPAVERFFRRLDFDISIDNTQVRARYDKERAFDLGDLCEKAASLFRLAPYLMDVDWIIGDLALGAEARKEVATAWADHFAKWGVLPHKQLLTADRRGVLAGVDADPAGEREVRWDGTAPYRDSFAPDAGDDVWTPLAEALQRMFLDEIVHLDSEGAVAQLAIEERLLRPLRQALARGEAAIVKGTIVPQRSTLFERRDAAECLAAILSSDAALIAPAVHLADVVALLARGLRFTTSGAINGHEVQHASLPLPGRVAGLDVLRDASGIIRLAIYTADDALYTTRASAGDAWKENWSTDAPTLVAMLRRANYPTPWVVPPAADPAALASQTVEIFRRPNRRAILPPLASERLLGGVAASPGRAAGLARLGIAGRHPDDVEAAIVVCHSMTPADGAYIASASGVVSTGGGALSHAGLLALQYGKPALIVPGVWRSSDAGAPLLAYRATHYEEESHDVGPYHVTRRGNVRLAEEILQDGDLVVLDADDNLLRVLGSGRDALMLNDALHQLDLAARLLAAAVDDGEVLKERGKSLRAEHQLEKVLCRIDDEALATHAAAELLRRPVHGERDVASREWLLGVLFGNPWVGDAARGAVRATLETLGREFAAEHEEAMRLIPQSTWPWEILSLRLDVLRCAAMLRTVTKVSATAGVAVPPADMSTTDVEEAAQERLAILRAEFVTAAARIQGIAPLRQLLDEIDRLDIICATDAAGRSEVARLHHVITIADRAAEREAGGRRVLDARAGGLELRRMTGNKAANLAQIAQLDEGALVPPWFVVTDRAFREVLASKTAGSQTVGEAVASIVARTDITNAQKSLSIQQTWAAAELSPVLVHEVSEAYASLSRQTGEEQPFVAVRSSAREEDLEAVARAGEFDTFLFVRGEAALLDHLRRAWSGLWTERALHNRALVGSSAFVGGGVLVQKMISSAVSGVLHTVNVAERRPREMVINAGLGLGEGVVSGLVAADRIIVSKEGDLQHGELHFRYLTAEKRERVVFNSRLGSGTARVETLYHQRLRPALEYVDICELVRAAARLEAAYRYPLDIEFAIEGTSLYILQVRPIPTPFAVWRETMERWPLKGRS